MGPTTRKIRGKKSIWSGNRVSGALREIQTCGNVVPTDVPDDPNMWSPNQLRLSKKLGPFEGEVVRFWLKSIGIPR